MAKSPVGGSRAFLMGRIGSDVYSLGKDGKGKRQQVVRALAEEVANPRTSSQMFNRMIMSTVMQAVHAMALIIDHSFDGVAKGQPSISEFIRRNYALVKADAIANPASGNKFGLVKYEEKGARTGNYVVSAGKVVIPSTVIVDSDSGDIQISLDANDQTIGGLKKNLGVGDDGYFTIVSLSNLYGFKYCRLRINTELADNTAITGDNIASVFVQEGNKSLTPEFDAPTIIIPTGSMSECMGLILTQKQNGAFKHSTCTLDAKYTNTYTSDVALPTYPVGEEQFLNGGDI